MPFPTRLTKKWGAEVGWACMVCGKKWTDGWALEAHHRIPTHMGGKDTRDNFSLLCIACHENAHRKLAERDTHSANLIHERLQRTKGRWR